MTRHQKPESIVVGISGEKSFIMVLRPLQLSELRLGTTARGALSYVEAEYRRRARRGSIRRSRRRKLAGLIRRDQLIEASARCVDWASVDS